MLGAHDVEGVSVALADCEAFPEFKTKMVHPGRGQCPHITEPPPPPQALTSFPTLIEYPRGLARRVEFPVPYEYNMTARAYGTALRRLSRLAAGVPAPLRATLSRVAAAAEHVGTLDEVPAGAAEALADVESAIVDAQMALRRLEFAAAVLRLTNKPGGAVVAAVHERSTLASSGHRFIVGAARDALFMELAVLADFAVREATVPPV